MREGRWWDHILIGTPLAPGSWRRGGAIPRIFGPRHTEIRGSLLRKNIPAPRTELFASYSNPARNPAGVFAISVAEARYEITFFAPHNLPDQQPRQ